MSVPRGPARICSGDLSPSGSSPPHEGVEPTNNSSEQALRPGVRWRDTSFGSPSERGSKFTARILTVLETCRRQGRSQLDYLVDWLMAWLVGLSALSSVLPALASGEWIG